MDWGNTIELAGIVLGSGGLGVFATWIINRRKERLSLEKQEFQTEADMKAAYRTEANLLAQDVIRLEKKTLELELQVMKLKSNEQHLAEKYQRATDRINTLERNNPLKYIDDVDSTSAD